MSDFSNHDLSRPYRIALKNLEREVIWSRLLNNAEVLIQNHPIELSEIDFEVQQLVDVFGTDFELSSPDISELSRKTLRDLAAKSRAKVKRVLKSTLALRNFEPFFDCEKEAIQIIGGWAVLFED